MEENYVSFEIAKLLKEKGFDERCYKTYNSSGDLVDSTNFVYGPKAPTLQMACKWLRENHNIHIEINCDICDSLDFYSIIRVKGEESWITCSEYEDEGNATYEEAMEKAIKYCLTNLI